MAKGVRNPRLPTKAQQLSQLEDRMTALEQIVGQIYQAATNDILRFDELIRELCENTGVPFVEPLVEPNIGEAQEGSE